MNGNQLDERRGRGREKDEKREDEAIQKKEGFMPEATTFIAD